MSLTRCPDRPTDYVIRNDWTTKEYTYFSQCLGVGLCAFAFPAGFVMACKDSYPRSASPPEPHP